MISTRFTLPLHNLSDFSTESIDSIKRKREEEQPPLVSQKKARKIQKDIDKIGTIKRYRKLAGFLVYLFKHAIRYKIITEIGTKKTIYFNKRSARKRSLQLLMGGKLPIRAERKEKAIARMFLEKVLGPHISPYLAKHTLQQRNETTFKKLQIPESDHLLRAINQISPVPVVRHNTGDEARDIHNLEAVLTPGDLVFVNRERNYSNALTVVIRWSQKLCRRGVGPRRLHNTTHVGMIYKGRTMCEATGSQGCLMQPINTIPAINFRQGTDTEYLVYKMTEEGKKALNVNNMLELMQKYAKPETEGRPTSSPRSFIDLTNAENVVVGSFRTNIEYCNKTAVKVMFKSSQFNRKAKEEMIIDMLAVAYDLPYPVNKHGKIGHICSSFAASIMQTAQHQQIRELIQSQPGTDLFTLDNNSRLAKHINLLKNPTLSPQMRARVDKSVGKMLAAQARQIVAKHGDLLSKDNVAFPFRAHYSTPRDVVRFVIDHPQYFQLGARIIAGQYPERMERES